MANSAFGTALTAATEALGSKPTIEVVNSVQLEVDITPNGTARTWVKVCTGFENISEELNEEAQQYFFLCAKGYANNYVTGLAPVLSLSGRRVLGDAAQDYMFGAAVKYAIADARSTNFRLTRFAGTDSQETISFHGTFTALSDLDGDANEGSAVSIEISYDGSIVIGDAFATT